MAPAGRALARFIALLVFHAGAGGTPAQSLSYTTFVSDVTANKVSTAAITSQIPIALNDSALPSLLLGHRVQVTGSTASTGSVLGLVVEWFLPIALIVVLFIWLGRTPSRRSRSFPAVPLSA